MGAKGRKRKQRRKAAHRTGFLRNHTSYNPRHTRHTRIPQAVDEYWDNIYITKGNITHQKFMKELLTLRN